MSLLFPVPHLLSLTLEHVVLLVPVSLFPAVGVISRPRSVFSLPSFFSRWVGHSLSFLVVIGAGLLRFFKIISKFDPHWQTQYPFLEIHPEVGIQPNSCRSRHI